MAADLDSSRRRIRVIERDGGISIFTGDGDLRVLRYTHVRLIMRLWPEQVGTSLVADLPNGSWIDCDIERLGMGFGNEEESSAIADDSISVIVGDRLEAPGLPGVRLISCSSLCELHEEVRVASQDGREAAGVLAHSVESDANAYLYLTLGVPEDEFADLFEHCRRGHVDEIYVDGTAVGLSSAAEGESGRDIVLRSTELLPVRIETLVFTVGLVRRRPMTPQLMP